MRRLGGEESAEQHEKGEERGVEESAEAWGKAAGLRAHATMRESGEYLNEEDERSDCSEFGRLVAHSEGDEEEAIAPEPSASSACASASIRRWALGLILVLVLLMRWQAVTNRPKTSRFASCHSAGPVLVGSHHKTGTVLLTHLLRDACKAMHWKCIFNHDKGHCASAAEARNMGADICLLQHGIQFKGLVPSGSNGGKPQHQAPTLLAAATAVAVGMTGTAGTAGTAAPQPSGRSLRESMSDEPTYVPNYRFVHAIRDPMEVVLSGYTYHLRTTEKWANRPEARWNGTTYRAYLNALSLEEGLLAEVRHSARDNLKTMPRLYERTGSRKCTYTVKFEDFATDWEGTLTQLWDLLGVTEPKDLALLTRVSEKHNVYRHNTTRGRHVSSTSASKRAAMRELLRRSPDAMARIREVRRKLGYPLVGEEGKTR